ncbi:MAG: hypothetical protein VKK97_08300 [Synechococcaceae cyanobacterium]|nr:hypothetical protein [Synechococcaceae cyanobacterium]
MTRDDPSNSVIRLRRWVATRRSLAPDTALVGLGDTRGCKASRDSLKWNGLPCWFTSAGVIRSIPMTYTKPLSHAQHKSHRPDKPAAPSVHPGGHGVDPVARRTFLSKASDLEQQARQAAERGDLQQAGRLILEILVCERKAGSLGPQVLQLIKPRA